MEKINAYFVARPRLTLALTWIFTAIAVAIGVIIAVFYTEMDYFKFLAWVAIPVILGIYFRIMYGRVQNARREQQEREGKLANQTRYGSAKKKKRRK